MKLGIMQPYFMPYIGYWQLMKAVDKYVLYDNIQYTKKGWINRNRILMNGKDVYITIPLEKKSDYLDICERELSKEFDRKKMLNQLSNAYLMAPYYNDVFGLLQDIINFHSNNLFTYIYYSIKEICKYIRIDTEIVISSTVNIDHSLKGQNKVFAICEELEADKYINAIGGQELYDKNEFEQKDIELSFLQTEIVAYKQFKNDFLPYLSIIDVLMFNSVEEINLMLDKYKLI